MIEAGDKIKFCFTTLERYNEVLAETRKSREILYIHGYRSIGSTGKTLQKLMEKYTAVHIISVNENPDIAFEDINKYLEENPQIDLVAGSSLGGFITSRLKGCYRLLINPCMKPSIELPKIGCPEEIYSLYEKYESEIPDTTHTYLLFGTNDELFSYKDECIELYGENKVSDMPGVSHHLNEQELEQFVVPMLLKIISR